jgi:Na+/melibiose symporter-like transporter
MKTWDMATTVFALLVIAIGGLIFLPRLETFSQTQRMIALIFWIGSAIFLIIDLFLYFRRKRKK